ncbi:MAG: hypothetical protein V5A55_08905 [Halovenus sp.]
MSDRPERRRFLIGAVTVAAAGCTAIGENRSTEAAATALEERVTADPHVDAVQTEFLEDDHVEVWVWYSIPDGDGRINLLPVYADLVANGYEIGDLLVNLRTRTAEERVLVQREWAEQFNAGEITREQFSRRIGRQI